MEPRTPPQVVPRVRGRGRGRAQRGTTPPRGTPPTRPSPPTRARGVVRGRGTPPFDRRFTQCPQKPPPRPPQRNTESDEKEDNLPVIATSDSPVPVSSTEDSPLPVEQKKDKQIELRREILETERYYVSSLRHLVELYIKPLRALQETEGVTPILTASEMSKLFSSIELILNVNEELLASLENLLNGKEYVYGLGDVFLEFAPYLKLYNQYSANYDDAIKVLEQLKSENDRFSAFLMASALSGDSEHTEISFYLIMPIQRIPRYIMLLSDLLKRTTDEKDKENINCALLKIKDVATNVNNSIREAEHTNKLVEMQSTLTGFEGLMIPSRRLIKEGNSFHRISTKGVLMPRSLFLFNDLLLLTLKRAVKVDIKLHLTWIKELPDADKFENVFQIASNKKTLVLCASSAKERDEWINLIAEQRSKLISATPSLQKERAEIESCLQPHLHANFFQIDEYVEPIAFGSGTGNENISKVKRTRNANSMLESLSTTDPVEVASSLFELSEDYLEKYIRAELKPTNNNNNTTIDNHHNTGESKIPPQLNSVPSRGHLKGSRRTKSEIRGEESLRLPVSDLISPVINGFLTKQGGRNKTWKKRWFVLKAKYLFYFKTKQDENPVGIMSLEGYSVQKGSKSHSIQLSKSGSRTYYLVGQNDSECSQWIDAIQESINSGNGSLDYTCITPLIALIFYECKNSSIINREAAWRLESYCSDVSSDSALIQYLGSPTSIKPLRKLMISTQNIVKPIQLTLLRKLVPLSLVVEVGKSLIAQGVIECIYTHLGNPNSSNELQELSCAVLASMTRFDFFPITSSMKPLLNLIKLDTPSNILYELSTIIRNISPMLPFRKIIVEENALSSIYNCFSCDNEKTVEKFLQALLLLICDRTECNWSASLFSSAVKRSLNALTPMLQQCESSRTHWVLMKVINTIVVGEPSLLQSLDISVVPRLTSIFLDNPDPSLLFELTRFFNMMSRNHWIRGTLDNNPQFIQHLVKVIDEVELPSTRELGLRCLANLCTSDKNKTVASDCAIDVLLRQITSPDPRVNETAMHCISHILMNDKGKIAFARDDFVEILCTIFEGKKHPCKLRGLQALQHSTTANRTDFAERVAISRLPNSLSSYLQSMNDTMREHGCKAISVLSVSGSCRNAFANNTEIISTLMQLLSDNPEIAVSACGCIGNIFHDTKLKQQCMSEQILSAIYSLLSKLDIPRQQYIVLQTLTIISYQDSYWSEQIYLHKDFALIREIQQTGADKQLRIQTMQLFSSIFSQISYPDDPAARGYQNVQVVLNYFRPRFSGYVIV